MAGRLFRSVIVAMACASASAGVSAATITYDTRRMNDFTRPAVGGYRAWWFDQSTTITSQSLTAFTNVRVPNGLADTRRRRDDAFSHLRVTFTAPDLQSWLFEFAPDAGYGGALYVNDAASPQDVDSTDLWWGGNWSNQGELLRTTFAGNGLPAHIDLYWAEGCCNGGQSARFSTNGGTTWRDLTVANLDAAAVPLPAAAWLLGSALAAMSLLRRRHA